MTKKLGQKLQSEVEEFCSSSSTHGLGYFFRFTLMDRFFWVLATVIMLTLGGVLINQMRQDWETNQTVLRPDSSRLSVETVARPAITICSDFTPDKWGFMRRLLNEVKFQCNSDETCQETEALRQFFYTQFLHQTWISIDLTQVKAPFLQQLTHTVFERLIHQHNKADASDNQYYNLYFFRELHSFEYFNIFHHLYESVTAYNQTEAVPKIRDLLTKKLQGQRDFYGVQRDLNMTSFAFAKNSMATEVSGVTDETRLLLSLILTMPGPGRFGSTLFNYAQDQEWAPQTRLKKWNNPARNISVYQHPHILELYESVYNTLFDDDHGLSIVDVAPILTVMPNYIDDRKYSLMFRHSVFSQTRRTQPEFQGSELFVNNYLDEMPKFLSEKGYFGKVLGSNLLQVMEVMYHCSLRAGRFREDWTSHSAIYGQGLLTKLLPFPFGQNDDYLAHPSVDDFNKDEMSFRPVLDYGPSIWALAWYNPNRDRNKPDVTFQFDHATPITFDNDTEKAAADQILVDLRKKYQHQQMVLYCRENHDTNCENWFRPVFTDKGICYALNTPSIQSSVHPSTYMDYFTSVFVDQSESNPVGNLSSGYTVMLILDSHQTSVFDHEPGTFWVGINQQRDFMSVRRHGIAAQPGMHTHIQIEPAVNEATERFQKTGLDTRKCRFENELNDDGNSSMFKTYSFKSCDFECRLKHGEKKCGCIPWNYPHQEDQITRICDGVEAFCFDDAFNDDYDKDECSCLQDCQEVVYHLNDFRHVISSNQECDLRLHWNKMMFRNLDGNDWDTVFPPRRHLGFHRDLPSLLGEKLRHLDGAEQHYWIRKLTSDDFPNAVRELFASDRYLRYVAPQLLAEHCADSVANDLVYITIEVPGSLASKVVKDLKFSFTDKISALGGTVGLFTGMSLLSMIEAIYWLTRMITIPLRVHGK